MSRESRRNQWLGGHSVLVSPPWGDPPCSGETEARQADMAKAEAGQAGGTPAPTQGLWPCQWPLRPPSPRTRRQETRTGLQRALAHDRGEGAQALRRARRQPERILRVGLEVLHHKGRGWVEGAAHLRMGGGSGWRDAGRGGGSGDAGRQSP